MCLFLLVYVCFLGACVVCVCVFNCSWHGQRSSRRNVQQERISFTASKDNEGAEQQSETQ